MKKLYIIVASLAIALTSFGQTVQATIKPGSQANSVYLAIKPSADMMGAKISTLYFSVGIPTSVGAAPTVAIMNNFNANIGYTTESGGTGTANGGSHYLYNFLGDGAQTAGTERDYLASGDNNMLELSITGGGAVNLADVIVVSLPDGGTSYNTYFNIYNQGTDVTNQAAMFYGTGAVNSASGYTGTSFKPVGETVPVHFLSFYAIKNGDDAKLNWTVENDIDNAFFEVQRSVNGITYNTIGKVNAYNNGKSSNNYELADPRLSDLGSKNIYYRIKQVDNNGTITYSAIRNLNLTINKDALNLYPNPAKTTTKLVVDIQYPGKGTLVIRDATGKQVQLISMEFVKGINQKDLNVSMLPSGEYNLTVLGANLNQTIKFRKIN